MPLASRIVEPFRLGRKPLLPEDKDEGPNAERAVIHNAVLGAMLQLTSLIRHADDIFCDLTEECQIICDKTDKITRKINHIEDLTRKLDSKKVQIPVGDLKKYSTVNNHHTAYHGYDCHMFTADSRPQCIRDRYSLAEITPAKILRGADAYRKDGLYSSLLFKLWPVFSNDQKIKSPDLSFPRRMQPVVSFKKDYKKLKFRERPKTVALDDLNNGEKELDDKEEGQLTPTKTPSTIVIDTSGSGFHRMCSFRESLKSDPRRSKRRTTVSGVPDNILQEIYDFEKEKRIGGRIQPRSYSFDDLDAEDDNKKDEIMAQYFDEIDAKYEEMLEDEYVNKEPRYMKFIPCRRTRSLPRCVKPKRTGTSIEHRMSSVSSNYASSSSLNRSVISVASSRFSRATKRSSFIGNKIKSMVQNVSNSVTRSRPKSLDLDALDFSPESEVPTRARSTVNLPSAASMPDGILSNTSSEQSIGPGTYYYFESNTIPKAQAKKYDFPWESLPKDWTTSVKLREISKRRPKEERHSSSGHWSASSCSNRQSVESGKSSMPSSYSAYSLGKDSGRDSPSFSENRNGTSIYKDSSDATEAVTESQDQFTKMDTETWLKNLAMRTASREDIASSSINTLSSLSKLTRQNILELDLQSPELNKHKLEDEFSEFSVDQDGFYTSFHNDSGLRRSNANLDEDDTDLSPTKDTPPYFHMGSTNTIDSVIFRPTSGPGISLGPGKATVLKRVSGKLPPPPPRRTCSMTSISFPISESTFEVGEASPTISEGSSISLNTTEKQRQDSSFSESDQESIYARLKLKTQIPTSAAYPSWCSVSPSDSGEEIRVSPCAPGDSLEVSNIEEKLDKDPSSKTELKQMCSHNHSGNTLPRTRKYLSNKNWDEDIIDQSNSWPRSQKSGILKTDNSTCDASKPAKTINFDPVVNMFDVAGKTDSTYPLHEDSYKLAIPFIDEPDSRNTETIPIKYQPTITVTPKGRQMEGSMSSSAEGRLKFISHKTPVHQLASTLSNHYAVSNLKGFPIRAPSEVSASSLSISSLCADEGGYMDMSSGLKNRSNDNLSSCSSLALSDIDNSMTYVSMSSPFSTPVNSTLNLNKTESVSRQVIPQKDTYRVSSALLAAAGANVKGKDVNSNSISGDSEGLLKSSKKYDCQRSSSVYYPHNVQSKLKDSAPISLSPVVVINNSTSSLPHSDTWPNCLHSSTKKLYPHPDQRSINIPQDQDISSSNACRTDSYRVAMRTDASEVSPQTTKRAESYRFAVNKECERSSSKRRSTGSMSSQNSSPRSPDADINVNRADSYRIAVRQTNGIVSPDNAITRNLLHSVAMKNMNGDSGKQLVPTNTSDKRDSRRRGITNIDQLKDFSGEESHRKFSLKSASNLFATINSSKKRMNVKSEIESLLRPTSNPSPETHRSVKSPKSPKSPKTEKDKTKNKEHRSSTYIRFDPIFEDKEDFLNSSRDSLQTPSISSLNKSISERTSTHYSISADDDPLLGKKLSHPLPVTRGSRSSLSNRKVDDKAVMSILDSIKSTIKNISTKKIEGEGDARYATDV